MLSSVQFQGKFFLHYNSSKKSEDQVSADLQQDGIHPTESLDRPYLWKDYKDEVMFDRVRLLDIPDEQDRKLGFSPAWGVSGKYNTWPYGAMHIGDRYSSGMSLQEASEELDA